MSALWARIWRYALGVLLTLTPLTAIFVVGWVQRASRRAAHRLWARSAGAVEEPSRSVIPDWRARLWLIAATFGAGLKGLLPVTVLLAPAIALSLFSWWGGWENSFNKGYEQAWVGPTLGLLGALYFALIMIILPLGEARYAVTRSWPGFFNIAFLIRLAAATPLSLAFLSLAFLFGGLVVAILKIAPLGMGNADWPPQTVERIVAQYPLVCAALLFPLYAGLRYVAARTYATGVLTLARRGEPLPPVETEILGRLGFVRAPARLGASSARPLGSVAGLGGMAVAAMAWLAFGLAFTASQFLVHDWWGWVNHPLLQLPATISIFNP